jgi:GNAT superfamily N-acetyltransferase
MAITVHGRSTDVIVDVVEERGRVVGAMVRSKPGRTMPSMDRLIAELAAMLRPSYPRRFVVDARVRARSRFMLRARLRYKHWFIDALGVAPDHQRHGVGRRLMALAIARADEDRLPIQLFAFEDASGFYERLGFEKRVMLEDDGLPPLFAMVRFPGGREDGPWLEHDGPASTEWRSRMPWLLDAVTTHPPPRPLASLFFSQTEMSRAQLAYGLLLLVLISCGTVLTSPKRWSGRLAIVVLLLAISATLFRRALELRRAELIQGVVEGALEGREGYFGNVAIASGEKTVRVVVQIDRELMSEVAWDRARIEVIAVRRPGPIVKAIAVRLSSDIPS